MREEFLKHLIGTLDVLVNNAGIGDFKAFEEFNAKE